jgi:hypothetical protein
MPNRFALGPLVLAIACGNPPSDGGSFADSGSDLTDAGVDDASADADAVIDAAPDADVPDVTPPSVATVSPGAGALVWLHAPIRVTFDEPLNASSIALSVSATLAGSPVAAQLALEPPRTIAITLPASLRGVGTLELDITGSVADEAGNVQSAPIQLSFTAPAWHRATQDRGVARTAPALAVTGSGIVYAAWLVGTPGDRRAAVSALAGNEWASLGTVIGASDVSSVSIALDGASPIVAWSEAGQARIARWSAGWSELASPGAAATVAIAVPPGGSPLVARFGASTVSVHALAAGAWQPVGGDITLSAAIASSPTLVAMADGKPAVGWIDSAGELRVYRYDAAWTALAPISAGAGARMSLAARSTALAIAWQQRAGSWGVLAAQAAGAATAWTRLGRALDIDITGDAVGPAIAYDASGAPIVAWTELVETEQRGALARWTGSAWSIVGGVTWLDNPTASPLPARIALRANEAPVVATASGGQIRVARQNGPRIAAPGMATRASIAGCAFAAANPPASLALTGCFDLATPSRPVPHAGLVPFDVVSELWTDGAKKRRYIGLPDGASMTIGNNGAWTAPAGTLIIKQFDLETTPGDPRTRRPVETRFFVNDAALGWQGFTYRWNAAGTNATLLADGNFTYGWPMDDGSTHTHLYPSRSSCRSCHHASMGPLLGLRSEQLARWNDYGGVIADQLPTLSALGISPVASAQPHASPHDPGETFERRTRGYMAGNCAHCHNPLYLNIKDLRFTTALAQTRLCETIAPGSPSASRVYQLVTSRPGMPALGTLMVDPLAEQILGGWISGMTSCP